MTNGSTVYRPPVSFSFAVRLAGDKAALDASFQEASGLSVEMGVEEYAEGGLNQYKHRLPSYPKYGNLLLKRGLVLDQLPLFKWCQETLNGGFASPIKPRRVSVMLLGPDHKPQKTWYLFKAWPVKWSLSNLQSQSNEVLIESLELTYSYFKAQGS